MSEEDRERIRNEMIERLLESLLHMDTTAWIPETSGRMSLEEFTQKYGTLDLVGTLNRHFSHRSGNTPLDAEIPEDIKSLLSLVDEFHLQEIRNRLLESLKSMDFSVIERWHTMAFAADPKRQEDFQKAEEEFDGKHSTRDLTP